MKGMMCCTLAAAVVVGAWGAVSIQEYQGIANSAVLDVANGEYTLTQEDANVILGDGVVQFVKTGAGTLKNEEQLLAAFAGDVVVAEGTLQIKKPGDLGVVAETKTVVLDGAALKIASTYQDNYDGACDKILIAGRGPDNNGALKFPGWYACYLKGGIVLTADATISGIALLQDGNLDMGGHDLTVVAYGVLQIATPIQTPGRVFAGMYAEVQHSGMTRWGTNPENGTSDNTLTVFKEGFYSYNNVKVEYAPFWKLIMKDGSGMRSNTSDGTKERNAWRGPVILEGVGSFWSIKDADNGSHAQMSLFGNVSGSGSLNLEGPGSTRNNAKEYVMHLYGDNTYEGGTHINGRVELHTYSPSAISLAAPMVVSNAVSIHAPSDTESFWPMMTWWTDEATSFTGLKPTVAGLVKKGAGELAVCDSASITGTLEVVDGVVQVSSGRLRTAGLKWGYTRTKIDGSNYAWANGTYNGIEFNQVTNGAVYAYVADSLNSDKIWGFWPPLAVVYNGYIWNNSATNETWTFAESIDDFAAIRFDGQEIVANGVWNELGRGTVTVTPGSHSIQLLMSNAGGGGGPEKSTLPSGVSWSTKTDNPMGFAVDRLGRNSGNVVDYEKLLDPGDGSFLTWTDEFNGATTEKPCTNIADVVLTGGVLDLQGAYYKIPTVTAKGGAVTNGHVTVTTALSVAPTAEKGAFRILGETGSLTLADDAAINLVNADSLDTSKVYEIVNVPEALTWTRRDFANTNKWKIRKSVDGKTLTTYYSQNFMIIIR